METSFDFPEFADEAEQPSEVVELTAEQTELIVANLGLVDAIAHLIYGKVISFGNEFTVEDLAQQGSIGLIQAAKRYDPSSEASFQTFASRRIRGEILDFVRESRPHPRPLQQKTKKWMEAWGALHQELQREPTVDEVAAKTGFVEQHEIDEIRLAIANFNQRSLNSFVGNGVEGTEFVDLLEDPSADFSDRLVLATFLEHAMGKSLLTVNEREGIERYFFGDLTMLEVGKSLGVGESRASQIVTSGLKKIRTRNRLESDQARQEILAA